jgi:hypothetical protein
MHHPRAQALISDIATRRGVADERAKIAFDRLELLAHADLPTPLHYDGNEKSHSAIILPDDVRNASLHAAAPLAQLVINVKSVQSNGAPLSPVDKSQDAALTPA